MVEGHGERVAVPELIRRMLYDPWCHEQFQLSWSGKIEPFNAKGVDNLNKNLVEYLETARRDRDFCKGVLILRDGEGDCVVETARNFATQAKSLRLPFPVVVVCAACEFESWFLASLHTIAAKYPDLSNVTFPGDPEKKCNAKEWLAGYLPDNDYKETTDQPKMARLLDIEAVHERCRSFRRMVHAVEELLLAIDTGRTDVTPIPATSLPAS